MAKLASVVVIFLATVVVFAQTGDLKGKVVIAGTGPQLDTSIDIIAAALDQRGVSYKVVGESPRRERQDGGQRSGELTVPQPGNRAPQPPEACCDMLRLQGNGIVAGGDKREFHNDTGRFCEDSGVAHRQENIRSQLRWSVLPFEVIGIAGIGSIEGKEIHFGEIESESWFRKFRQRVKWGLCSPTA